MLKITKKQIFKYSLYIVLFIGIERFCYTRTAGFRESKILSKITSSYPTPSISEEKKEEVKKILSQEYFYLGKGSTCYCFESKDKKHVIKFFLHHRLEENGFLFRTKLPSFLSKFRDEHYAKKQKIRYRMRKEFVFPSVEIAATTLKDYTGVVHAQLCKSKEFSMPFVFFDKIGIKHVINLKDTEFVVQKKGELIFSAIDRLLQLKEIDQVKVVIDSLIQNVTNRCLLGFGDKDPHLSINFACDKNRVLEIDVGSFFQDNRLKDPIVAKEEIRKILQSLTKRLEKQQLFELVNYANMKIEQL